MRILNATIKFWSRNLGLSVDSLSPHTWRRYAGRAPCPPASVLVLWYSGSRLAVQTLRKRVDPRNPPTPRGRDQSVVLRNKEHTPRALRLPSPLLLPYPSHSPSGFLACLSPPRSLVRSGSPSPSSVSSSCDLVAWLAGKPRGGKKLTRWRLWRNLSHLRSDLPSEGRGGSPESGNFVLPARPPWREFSLPQELWSDFVGWFAWCVHSRGRDLVSIYFDFRSPSICCSICSLKGLSFLSTTTTLDESGEKRVGGDPFDLLTTEVGS
jgi:hypothetical protein